MIGGDQHQGVAILRGKLVCHFDGIIKFDSFQNGAFGKGDRQTLTREAEAIIALASQRAQALNCIGCGTEVVADMRFCRKCGAPVKVTAPTEFEVLRLTAGSRAGYQWTWVGVVILLFAGMFPMLAGLAGKPMHAMWVIWAIFSPFGAWALGAGLRRTHLTLNPKEHKEELPLPAYSPNPIATPITNELPRTEIFAAKAREGVLHIERVLLGKNEIRPCKDRRRVVGAVVFALQICDVRRNRQARSAPDCAWR